MKNDGCCGNETNKGGMNFSGMMGACMPGAGSSPMDMCAKMMESVSTSAQMAGFATPEVRALFDEWASELANEILQEILVSGQVEPANLGQKFKISESAAIYFVTRLIRENKVKVSSIEAAVEKQA